MRALIVVAALCAACASVKPASSNATGASVPAAGGGVVVLASTIGPIEAGVVGALEDRFEQDSGIRVRHVGAGTGEALKIAERGSIDLVLVHARALEEKFVEAGFGTERIPLMYNDFVIVGPAADPAGVRAAGSAGAALRAIAAKEAPFVSRGDKSGTHVAELELWSRAGLKPSGTWYSTYQKGSEGNASTLRFTAERQAYTVIDRATWLSIGSGLNLAILCEKDEALLNDISLIPVNPRRIPGANLEGATTFVRWLTAADKGQKVIERFGVEKYGAPLFFPDSREWKAAHTSK
jgi:tungstate transport system substrate-binding protein